jgi:hypothetical protein
MEGRREVSDELLIEQLNRLANQIRQEESDEDVV